MKVMMLQFYDSQEFPHLMIEPVAEETNIISS